MAVYEVVVTRGGRSQSEKVEALQVHQTQDGLWLVFADGFGEVKRFKSADVTTVTRTED